MDYFLITFDETFRDYTLPYWIVFRWGCNDIIIFEKVLYGRDMIVFFLLLYPYLVGANLFEVLNSKYYEKFEEQKVNFLADTVTSYIKDNGWTNIIVFGHFPNNLYQQLNDLPYTFITSNNNEDDYYVEDAVPYHSNTVLINSDDFSQFEESLLKIISMPYWHPHAKIYLYYHSKETSLNIARIFFIFWYYRAFNVILIQDDDDQEMFSISQFYPYVSDSYDFVEKYGCYTARKLGIPISTFEEGFVCEKSCLNVSISTKVRANNLGTCLGYVTNKVSYKDTNTVKNIDLFPDKGKNFHGFPFRGFTTEILPFMVISEEPDGTIKMSSRDGSIWTNMAKLLNFTIDLSSCAKFIKKPFDFDVNIQNIFAVAHRKGEFFLNPIYQFDVIVVELDYTFAYKDSGLCFMSRRAGYETVLFDQNTLITNLNIFIEFLVSFFCIWFIFCLYGGIETRLNMDFIGKNLMNSIRTILLINLSNPPKKSSFRIFLTITIWSFYIINFSTQATITSFFTASKRGHDVDTFEDIVEKGYKIEGVSSPDVFLPDDEERFRKINSRLSPIRDLFGCVKELSNDTHRFCLIDCSVGRYLQRNQLNEKGEQYLHIAKDRVHSYYLNYILPKHSIFTENFDKHLSAFFEAGLIKKWEEYKFNNIKEEAPIKPLAMDDIGSVFNMYAGLLLSTIIVFFMELLVGNFPKVQLCVKSIVKKLTPRWKIK